MWGSILFVGIRDFIVGGNKVFLIGFLNPRRIFSDVRLKVLVIIGFEMWP